MVVAGAERLTAEGAGPAAQQDAPEHDFVNGDAFRVTATGCSPPPALGIDGIALDLDSVGRARQRSG